MMRVASLLLLTVVVVSAGKAAGKDKKLYSFDLFEDGFEIEAKSKTLEAQETEEGESPAPRERRYESFKYEISVGSHGFLLQNEYKLDSRIYGKVPGESKARSKNKTKVKLSFMHELTHLVEFTTTVANDTFNETQTVVNRRALNDWEGVVYAGDCSAEAPCTATFTTTDGCVKVVARSNTDGESGDPRVILAPDDIKLDYIITDACPLSSEDSAWAFVGTFASSEKSKIRDSVNYKGGKGKKGGKMGGKDGDASEEIGDIEEELDIESVHEDDSGLKMVNEDGVAAYFSWLEEVDCGEGAVVKRPIFTSAEVATEEEMVAFVQDLEAEDDEGNDDGVVDEESVEIENPEETNSVVKKCKGRKGHKGGKGKEGKDSDKSHPRMTPDVRCGWRKPKGGLGYKEVTRIRWSIHSDLNDGPCTWDPGYGVANEAALSDYEASEFLGLDPAKAVSPATAATASSLLLLLPFALF